MTIEFRCDNCQKTLRTADDKAGRTARCPDCGESVTVPGTGAAGSPGQSPHSDFETLAQAPPWRRSAPVEITCPMCGAVNESTTDRCLACGEPLDAQFARAGRLSTRFSDIWNTAWEIWSANLGINVASIALAGLVLLGFSFVVVAIFCAGGMTLGITANQGEPSDAILMALFGIAGAAYVVFFGIMLLMQVGLSRFGLDNVRSRNPSLETITNFSGRWFSSLVGMIVYAIAFAIILAPAIILMITGSFVMEDPDEPVLGLTLYLSGLFGQYAMNAIATMLLWPIPYILADRHTDRFTSLVDGPPMAMRHWKLSALLGLTNIGLIFVGTLTCGIGLLFTYSLGFVLFAVAYERCRVQGNPSADDSAA